MIGRVLATIALVGLLALNALLPSWEIGRRGSEARLRSDIAGAVGRPGEPLPELQLLDLEGRPFHSRELLGQRTLLVFERSVDW